MTQKLQAVRGMNDILPADSPRWQYLEDTLRYWLEGYGYHRIRTPILEPSALFCRGVGEGTDIVEKEMYSFVDSLNGESLTLRPENTAACARAVIEHHLLHTGPKKMWYMGPMFRHERPQKGRYRQFYQTGAEAFGYTGPDIDAEQILMCQRLWAILGIEDDVRLEINCLGNAEERAKYREALIKFFEDHIDVLDDTAKGRLHTNPLRILDSKNPDIQAILDKAPVLTEFLGEESQKHFKGVLEILSDFAVPYTINPMLVRGLDYYNLTVYEFITNKLGAQGTICGGGRYDGLVELLGGKPAPACGFAIGMERLLSLLTIDESELNRGCDVYVMYQNEASLPMAFQAAEQLRDMGLDVLMQCGASTFKAQMKKADAAGAMFAVLIGDEEREANEVTVKSMRCELPQERVPLDQILTAIEQMMEKGGLLDGSAGS